LIENKSFVILNHSNPHFNETFLPLKNGFGYFLWWWLPLRLRRKKPSPEKLLMLTREMLYPARKHCYQGTTRSPPLPTPME